MRFWLPAIVLLLPVGFVAGHYIDAMNPEKSLGAAFSPLVGLAVAVILFDGGLELDLRDLEGPSQRVVRRLLFLGIPDFDRLGAHRRRTTPRDGSARAEGDSHFRLGEGATIDPSAPSSERRVRIPALSTTRFG
jgi:hypothetical protein